MKSILKYSFIIALLSLSNYSFSQASPAIIENIPYLVTFGAESDSSWGDDDFQQTLFFNVPTDNQEDIYIRVFDPGIGGAYDELKGEFNTKVLMAVYGGIGCYTGNEPETISTLDVAPLGTELASKTFDNNLRYDDTWYSFGPFNTTEGELVEKFGSYVFKLVIKGLSGDDGNLYKVFMSNSPNENSIIQGGNIFTFKYAFRLSDDVLTVGHIYPYLDEKVTSVRVSNFDWDNDGLIRIISINKRGELCTISGDGNWSIHEFPIDAEERNTSMDIQLIKSKNRPIKNNNVVIFIQNQYGESLPFYASPIGGIPVYVPKMKMKSVQKKTN